MRMLLCYENKWFYMNYIQGTHLSVEIFLTCDCIQYIFVCMINARRTCRYPVCRVVLTIYIYIYIRLKIKPNSVRIRFQSCQIFVLPSTGFEPTPFLHCSTIRLALRPAPQTTRLHPLPIKGASIVVVLPCLVRQIQGQA